MYYWQNAHRFFEFNLEPIMEEYSEDSGEIVNSEAISKRNEERKPFLEFHYALGGLLTYQERYNCLARIFRYTTTIPPEYVLLPETMDEIIEMYINFRDPYRIDHPLFSFRYNFPELEGLDDFGIRKKWICIYIAILFLRQYTITPHLITMSPMKMPAIPKTQRDKKNWIDNIEYFKKLVKDVLENTELIRKIGLAFITKKWCKENKMPHPEKFLEDLKITATNEYEKTKIEQNISQNKRNKYNKSTNDILTKTIILYDKITNQKNIETEFDNWFISGERTVIDKSAFSDDQEASHANFDSFFAEGASKKYKMAISDTFFFKISKSYLLKDEEAFSAIDRLHINGEDYLIVGFRQRLPYYIKNLGVKGLTEERYKDVDIINYPVYNYQLMGPSFFVLKKSDLPKILHKKIEDTEIEKYSLKLINENVNLYTSIIDLNKSPKLQEEIAPSAPDRDLRKSVLLNIAFKTEIRWKKKVEVIQIKSFSHYKERGLTHKLKDVKAIKKQKKLD